MSDFTINRGDTTEWKLTARKDGVAIDLTGGQVFMAVRRNYASPLLFQRTSAEDGGITIDDGTGGTATIELKPEDTLNLANDVLSVVYSIHVVTAAGKQYTVKRGTLEIDPIAWDGETL